MSFAAQEQALFDLLFDEDFLEEFLQDKQGALELYGLSEDEIKDFDALRTDSVKLEAKMRKNMLLGQMVKHLPLSFALLSSFDNGFDVCRSIIRPYLVQMNGFHRLSVFANQLLLQIEDLKFFHQNDKVFVEKILNLESQMMLQAARLEDDSALDLIASLEPFSEEVARQKLHWANNVSAHSLPMGFSYLKEMLCENLSAGELWVKLQKEPMEIDARMELVLNMNNKLLVTKPFFQNESLTDREVSFKTIELIEGFEPLIQSINGRNSAKDLMQLYRAAGAEEQTIEQVEQGLKVLWENGLLQVRLN